VKTGKKERLGDEGRLLSREQKKPDREMTEGGESRRPMGGEPC